MCQKYCLNDEMVYVSPNYSLSGHWETTDMDVYSSIEKLAW